MELAISLDRDKFVALFLKKGINWKAFLTEERVVKCFNEVSETHTTHTYTDIYATHMGDIFDFASIMFPTKG